MDMEVNNHFDEILSQIERVNDLIQSHNFAKAAQHLREISKKIARDKSLSSIALEQEIDNIKSRLDTEVLHAMAYIGALVDTRQVDEAFERMRGLTPFSFDDIYFQKEIEALRKRITTERHNQSALIEVSRMVEENRFDKALPQITRLRKNIDFSSPFRSEIESLYNDIRDISAMVLTTRSGAQQSEIRDELTPQYLEKNILPYIHALADFQRAIDSASGHQSRDTIIRSISQNSPVGLSLEGVSDAVQVFIENIIPWRRKHAEIMASYARREKQYELEKKRIEIREANLQLEKTLVETARMREELEKTRIANEISRLDLEKSKMQLAMGILVKVAPTLSEAERSSLLPNLLQPLQILVSSDLEISPKK